MGTRRPAASRRLDRSRRPRLRLSHEELHDAVEEALDALPEEFAAMLDNVVVTLEEEPTDDDLASVGIDPSDPEARNELFGLYQGIPLADRDTFYDALPDRVMLYAGALRRACATRSELIDEIVKTLLHELGHHFGLDEDDMPY